ncbi:BTAD domain-containing putative transcriptional regulator [Mangrovihabitans endophyticus]|uniref:OmpR/PhoB-type domain-containing protein n=1 Tax=Mangrovihabitans endophyticus TaxID=1751298 RepID=A0A8J3BW34_9ACTN|nr:BTAD domain-containing putative transcriptional regulator [Mangrovihabitans endophyticus]GGK78824.1 hypothetical protein GCM10012284_10920 [Mangrovihabitans endophyticus]
MGEPEAGLDIRLLGPVRIRLGGAETAGGADRRAAVLSLLALRANQPVTRDELVTAAWGDEPPATALGNIYKFISQLRRMLDPGRDTGAAGEMLSSAAGSYMLSLDEDAVDVRRFEKARDRARLHRAADDQMAELSAVEEALGLWHGEALAGVPGPHAAAQRTRLAELLVVTQQRHAELLLGLGRHNDAIAVLRELAAAYPVQEKFSALLMDALQAAGRDAEALTVYRRTTRMLRRLTGTEPGSLLRDAHRRATGAADAAGRTPLGEQVLVGRKAEVHLLRQAVTDLVAGTGGHLRLEGVPGIGKSAVLTAGLRVGVPAGYRTGWIGCAAEATHSPLDVLIECLAASVTGAEPAWLTRVRQATADRTTLVDVVVEALREGCAEAPLLLVVDDLQWADRQTLQLWPVLQRLTTRLPLLLVSAARPDRTALAGLGWSGVIPLGPLPVDEASAVVTAAVPGTLDESAAQRIVADAGGNPCYLLAGVAAAQQDDDAGPGSVPAAMAVAVTRHLAALDEPTRHVLRAVAFLGEDCDVVELSTATGRSVDALSGPITAARAAGFITASGETITFRHRIVARVLHDSTSTGLRTMLHRSFADRLAAAGVAPHRVVSQLLAASTPLGAEMSAWMARHIEAAIEQSPREAVELLRRAHLQSDLPATDRLYLTASLARLLFRLGQLPTGPAEWVAARTPDAGLEAEMRLLVARASERSGDINRAAEVARWVLGAGRAPEPWMEKFRDLVARLRPQMSGVPTKPHDQTVTGYR